MKKKRKKLTAFLLLTVLLTTILPLTTEADTYQAATSYTNAKEFYDSTALEGEYYHAEATNGTMYYATCAKLASSSSNLKYYTLGFDVTLSGNGYSVSFAIQRTGGSMSEVHSVEVDGYQYILYAVDTDTLITLANTTDSASAAYVFAASQIGVTMNAIMTTVDSDGYNGSIVENGSGGLTESGTIYHLNNSTDLTAIKNIFTGHTFESYINIYATLPNYLLSIRYAIDGTALIHNSSSTRATVDSSYTLSDMTNNGSTTYSVLHYNGVPYTNSARILQQMSLLSPSAIFLAKEGYHLNPNSEWIATAGHVLSSAEVYTPKTIDPDVGYNNKNIYLYANWIPNNFSVKYDSNGGMGFVPKSMFTFDQANALRVNKFVKIGYTLIPGAEWNTQPDGSGTSYASGEVVSNLTSEHGKVITLYANWQEGIYEVSTNKDGGSGGTDAFYEKYKIGWYADADISNSTQSISIPFKTGYTFEGYYEYFFGLGGQITDSSGKILIEPDTYTRNSIVYASYIPKEYTITFNKQGGTGGTSSIKAIYNEVLPIADAPSKDGFTFKGYFTKTNGQGTQYYNEYMASDKLYQTDGNLTLYAYWRDTTPPITTINAPIVWSNSVSGIKVTASATDAGNGLNRIELYCGSTLVSSKTNLNGSKTASIDYYHKTEGVYQYKVLAYDMDENSSESYVTVRYDITAPNGTYSINNETITNYSISVDATDYKIQ